MCFTIKFQDTCLKQKRLLRRKKSALIYGKIMDKKENIEQMKTNKAEITKLHFVFIKITFNDDNCNFVKFFD